jgi:CubicO group peptidase (beta-lactamase class C family)
MTSPELLTLPPHPAGTSWPTKGWEEGEPGANVDTGKLATLMDAAFGETPDPKLGECHATLIVQHGKIVLEHYGTGLSAKDTFPSWSKAKSITHALVGILVREGKIDIHARADVPEWSDPSDPRHNITLDQLLRMSSGLAFAEEYGPDAPSDVIEMLWGKGKDDTGAFAASFSLEHEPDSFWSYSSGTTNIIARCAARALGASGQEFEKFMHTELLDPIGMTSSQPKFDTVGTFIGSSFCYSTARDFAKFGTLYLRDGVWEGKRILPQGWVDYARTPTPQTQAMIEEHGYYGAQWWLNLGGPGSFSANGFEGQFTIVVPDLDLILVRHGKTPAELGPNNKAWMLDVVNCFRSS